MEYFILAILLIQIILPVLDGLANLLLTIIEAAKGYFALKVAKYNIAMRDLSTAQDDKVCDIAPIGFSYKSIPEEEEDDNDL